MTTKTAYPVEYGPCLHLIILENGPRCVQPGREAPRDCLCPDYTDDLADIRFDEDERTRCEVWTRVMGYHRPVSAFNAGKQSEHAERCHFRERP